MRVLFVLPVEDGSGETVTSVHVAHEVSNVGWPLGFLGSEFALRLVPGSLEGRRWPLGRDAAENLRTWQSSVREFRPDLVLFADYPLMFFRQGSVPLARLAGWGEALDGVDATLVTFDHFGFAQQTAPLFLGPPHLGLSAQHFQPLPPRMNILLPCPMHEPNPRPHLAGVPFRSLRLPLGLSSELRRTVRTRWTGSDPDRFLVFHSVPTWAWRHAERLQLGLYDVLPRLLEMYFGRLADRIALVSINNGRLLQPHAGSRLQITNLGPTPVATFEELLYASDLVLSENGLSISLGKAMCARQIPAVLRNTRRLSELMHRSDEAMSDVLTRLEAGRLGAVFPFAAFPTVTPADIEAIGLYKDSTLPDGFAWLEIFGGRETADEFERLLTDDRTRSALHERQQVYIDRLLRLDDVPAILARMAGHS
jgi:Family of unknown function (DUF6365)